MANNNQIHDKDFEPLYKKIFETLVSSPAVKKELLNLLHKGKLSPQTIFVMMAKTDDMLQAIMQKGEEAGLKGNVSPKIPETRLLTEKKEQYIDGRKLSSCEVEFEEYCTNRFNEEEWLKQTGISFP
ncbi:MAG: hypothetical protein HZA01_07795 [Nitrospinae bacterium]|nr:hypothetical protein [Nitrospinota bacterium]